MLTYNVQKVLKGLDMMDKLHQIGLTQQVYNSVVKIGTKS